MKKIAVPLTVSFLCTSLAVLIFFLKASALTEIFSLFAAAVIIWLVCEQQKKCIALNSELEQMQEKLDGDRQMRLDEIMKTSEATRDSLEDFRSTLSHQLRIPLSVVQGYADLLARGLVTNENEKKAYLDKITEHCTYIGKVLSAQFSANRSAEEIKPIFSKVDIIEFIRGFCEDMRAIAARHNIRIQALSTLDSLIIEADPIQLNKIFYNILENSIKYMGRDGLVTICTELAGECVNITIKDNGLGLPQEETDRIFEYSYQGSNRTDGNGHGLFLAKRATEAHGGTISASSSSGMGMSTRIVLPVRQAVTDSE